jgi:hypothetical protein
LYASQGTYCHHSLKTQHKKTEYPIFRKGEKPIMITNTIQIRKKGSLTLPVELRNKYDLGGA